MACALIIVAIWFCAAGTYKHIPHLSQASPKQKGLTLKHFLRQILITLENRNYIFLIIGYFFFMITSAIYDTLNVFINTYFWELEPAQIHVEDSYRRRTQWDQSSNDSLDSRTARNSKIACVLSAGSCIDVQWPMPGWIMTVRSSAVSFIMSI
jgi:hypothetical protein